MNVTVVNRCNIPPFGVKEELNKIVCEVLKAAGWEKGKNAAFKQHDDKELFSRVAMSLKDPDNESAEGFPELWRSACDTNDSR